MGILSGTLSLILLFGMRPLTMPWFLAAAAVASIYWLGLIFAAFFPGILWVDPEFVDEVKFPLGLAPQQLTSYLLLALLVAAIGLAWWVH